MSMGTCFGIVPYVDGPNTGTIAGIVGAGKETALTQRFGLVNINTSGTPKS